MQEVAVELQRQQPSLMIYDRRRKLEWAARLQASTWRRCRVALLVMMLCNAYVHSCLTS